MPSQGITSKTSDREAEIVKPRADSTLTTPEDLLTETWVASTRKEDWRTNKVEYSRCKELLQSSLSKDEKMSHFMPKKNGFVHTVIMAYNNHHNLVIRPDDIWIAILSQLNIYVNAHAEELRNFFVAHEGKKRLELVYNATRWSMDYQIMAEDFATLLRKNINDPTLYELILPNFSTTTPHDRTICSITMMSILKAYFDFNAMMLCGIPEVTLLGTKQDYENILGRVQRLASLEMGAEPRAFAALLQPIIRRFIATFDAVAADPESPKIDKDFWNKICHKKYLGSGEPLISGWITAFCVWQTTDARWQGPKVIPGKLILPHAKTNAPWWENKLILDGHEYPTISSENIPTSMCEAPVHLDDNGKKVECMVVAGHLAAKAVVNGDDNIRTIAPAPVWFMFEKEDVGLHCGENTETSRDLPEDLTECQVVRLESHLISGHKKT